MADKTVATGDNGLDATQVADAAPSEDTAASDAKIFGKFADLDAAGKGYTEAEQKITEQGNELRAAREELTALRQQAQLAEKLDQIAQNTAKPAEQSMDLDTWVAEKADKIGMEPEALKEILGVSNTWLAEQSKQFQKEHAALKAEFVKELATLRDQQERLAPDYLQSKVEIDALAKELDVPLAKAKQIHAKMQAALGPATPDRETPPSTVNGARTTAGAGDRAKPYITDGDWATLQESNPQLTDADRKQMEANYQARVKAFRAEGGTA